VFFPPVIELITPEKLEAATGKIFGRKE